MEDITIQEREQKHLVFRDTANLELLIRQQKDSSVTVYLINLSGQNTENKIKVLQEATGCDTQIYSLCIARGTQQVDITTNVRHEIGGGSSRQILKYILADNARCSFLGELYIAPDAQKTDAQQTNRNLLLSATAKMRTEPQLEIYADDVKASHGASTGQLDESALFYMQQRGISIRSARQLLMEAFAEEVISTIPNEELQTGLRESVSSILSRISM